MENEKEREKVSCDKECGAYINPETSEEYKKAYEHWKNHNNMSGCSHGC